MYSDLVHPPSQRPAEDDTGGSVAGQPLELSVALLARAGHPTHSDLVADHLQTLPALDDSPANHLVSLRHDDALLYLHRELALHPTDVLLPHLSCPDLCLHLTSFSRISAEHQQSRRETVQSRDKNEIDISEVRQLVRLVSNINIIIIFSQGFTLH